MPDATEEELWCSRQREIVVAYLVREGIEAPNVGDWPAWHVSPIISIWAVDSKKRPGSVGWWAVSGDFPTDYTSCGNERHPRQGLRDIGMRWQEASTKWLAGEEADGWGLRFPGQETELAPLLAARAKLFLDIAANETNWDR